MNLSTRRVFLKSVGATLGLPALESLRPSHSFGAVEVAEVAEVAEKVGSAKRMVCIGNSFGMYQPDFFPKEEGRDYEMTSLLRPIERHREDFTVYSNLDHGIKGGHFSVHSYLSGVRVSDAKGMPDGNISLDQRAAEVIGGETRFPTLAVGSEDGLHGGCMMSWTRTGVRVPPTSGPRELFEKLFVTDGEGGKAAASDRFNLKGSILDAVTEDAKRLEKRLSGRDKEKLDEYFSSVREVELQIQQREKWQSVPKPGAPIERPDNAGIVDDMPMLYQLIALALETDSTRIATLELADGSFETSVLGVDKGYHALSHHGQDPKNIAGLVQLEMYQMEQFGKFLDRLKSVKTATGASLLDETAVLFGSGMGNANAHTNSDLPIILAGGGYQLGEHRILPEKQNQRVPLCNLFLSLLQRMGIEDDHFGTSSGTMTGLS